MDSPAHEVNFDGIVGPTHNYSGLSYGNVASMNHKLAVSNPKSAALQGLEKMRLLSDLGMIQGVIPPHERPYIPILRSLGFHGSDEEIIRHVAKEEPSLLSSCYSAAAMWAANSATVSPSTDSLDARVHLTPANLCSKFHRSFEPCTTSRILTSIFTDPNFFVHHKPLPPSNAIADEGAANHTRFCAQHGVPGIQLFVYGRTGFNDQLPSPKRFPARQTLEAAHSIARMHRLHPGRVIYAQQNPQAVDLGVFHNDVISVGNENVFFYHELAFINTQEVIDAINKHIKGMVFLKVSKEQVSLEEAIRTYLFNSQLVTLPSGKMALIAPSECQDSPSVKAYLDELLKQPHHPIRHIHYVNLRESMQNGGGPACLRLRVVLNRVELAAINPHILLNDSLYHSLKVWIERHYRDRLTQADLADPQLIQESRDALDELTEILHLGSVYDFQL